MSGRLSTHSMFAYVGDSVDYITSHHVTYLCGELMSMADLHSKYTTHVALPQHVCWRRHRYTSELT